jgi:putative DNA primase/helicase
MLKQIFQSIADKYGEQEQDAFISHFFELLGYIIQSNKNHPVMIFWQGRGKTGKSTLAKFVKRLVGDKATLDVKIKDFFDPKNTHNTTALEGKLLVLDQDMNTSTILSDGIMKNISENCELDVNPKNQKHKKITVHTTVLAITNVTVYSNDASDGFKRRIFAAYFERPMGDLADSKIPSQAAQEMPGILNAALDGYARLRKRGDFLLPQSALDFRDRFVMASHSVLDFWGNLGKQPLYGHKIETSKVYSKYCQFMIEDGEGKTHSKQTFIDALAGNGVKIDRERLTGWTIDLGSENKKGI